GGAACLVLSGFAGPLNIVEAAITVSIILGFFVIGMLTAIDYRRRLSDLVGSSLEFVVPILVILAVPAILLLGVISFRFSTSMLAGLVLLSLSAMRSILTSAMRH